MKMEGLISCQMSSGQLVDQVVYFRVVVYTRTSSHVSGKDFAFGDLTFVNPGITEAFIFLFLYRKCLSNN